MAGKPTPQGASKPPGGSRAGQRAALAANIAARLAALELDRLTDAELVALGRAIPTASTRADARRKLADARTRRNPR